MEIASLCRGTLHFFWPVHCAFCGQILPPDTKTDQHCCPACRNRLFPQQLLDLPGLDCCFVRTAYTEPVARAVYRLKFHHQPQLADTFAQLIVEQMAMQISSCRPDCICGVAMHPRRQRRRGYNQADKLAQQLALRLELPYTPLLKKCRNTAAQHTLSAEQRQHNLTGAYTVPCPQQVSGKRVLIADDIVTTGATLSECAKALYAAGAQWVGAVCFARPLRPQEQPGTNCSDHNKNPETL